MISAHATNANSRIKSPLACLAVNSLKKVTQRKFSTAKKKRRLISACTRSVMKGQAAVTKKVVTQAALKCLIPVT